MQRYDFRNKTSKVEGKCTYGRARSRDENVGRFADVLALGAVIVFREENAGRLANDLAMGTGIRIRNREMLVAVQMTQLWYNQTNS